MPLPRRLEFCWSRCKIRHLCTQRVVVGDVWTCVTERPQSLQSRPLLLGAASGSYGPIPTQEGRLLGGPRALSKFFHTGEHVRSDVHSDDRRNEHPLGSRSRAASKEARCACAYTPLNAGFSSASEHVQWRKTLKPEHLLEMSGLGMLPLIDDYVIKILMIPTTRRYFSRNDDPAQGATR